MKACIAEEAARGEVAKTWTIEGDFFERDNHRGGPDDARQRGRQERDAATGGNHHGNGLGPRGLQDDPGTKTGGSTNLVDERGERGGRVLGNGDQGFAAELAKGDLPTLRQSMTRGHKGGQRFLAPGDEGHSRSPRTRLHPDKASVQSPLRKSVQLLRREVVLHPELHGRVTFAKRPEYLDQLGTQHGTYKSETQPGRFAGRGASHGIPCADELR